MFQAGIQSLIKKFEARSFGDRDEVEHEPVPFPANQRQRPPVSTDGHHRDLREHGQRTPRTEEGGPYLRKRAVLTRAGPSDSPCWASTRRMRPEPLVKVLEVVQDPEA
jgi:hypothetical protein